jgi:hypothetical protein
MGTIGASRKGVVFASRGPLSTLARRAGFGLGAGGLFLFALLRRAFRRARGVGRAFALGGAERGAGRGRVGVVVLVVVVVVVSVKERTDAEILDASARVRVLTKLNELAMDALDLGDVTVEGDDDDGTGGGDDARVVHDALHVNLERARRLGEPTTDGAGIAVEIDGLARTLDLEQNL